MYLAHGLRNILFILHDLQINTTIFNIVLRFGTEQHVNSIYTLTCKQNKNMLNHLKSYNISMYVCIRIYFFRKSSNKDKFFQ